MRLGWILILATAVHAEPIDVALRWAHDWRSGYAEDQYRLYPKAPDNAVTPEDEDGSLLYLELEIAPERRLLAAVKREKEAVRIQVDLDLDGDLKEEEPVEMERDEDRHHARLTLTLREGESTLSVPVRFVVREDKIWVRLQAHRQGDAVLGGRRRRIVLLSGTPDLRFDDEDQDAIYIDLDGDGRITRGRNSHERVRPGEAFRAGRRGFALSLLDPSGARIRFTSVDPVPKPRARPWPKPPGQPGDERRRTYYSTSTEDKSLKQLISEYEQSKNPNNSLGLGSIFGADFELRQIGGIGSADSVRFLVKVARKEEQESLREAAAEALGNTKNVRRASIVAQAIRKESDPKIARALLGALAAMGDPSREELYLELLSTTRLDEIRAYCADNYAWRTPANRARLLENMGRYKRVEAEFHAYRAATRFAKKAPAKATLDRALEAKEARLRLLALRDLYFLGIRDTRPEIATLLAEAKKKRRLKPAMASTAIEMLGLDAAPSDIALLFSLVPYAALEGRHDLIDMLSMVREPETLEAIRGHLRDKQESTRELAVRVLARIPDPVHTELLVAQLGKERVPKVQLTLVTQLGRLGSGEATTPLVKLAQGARRKPELKEATVIALARIGFDHKPVARYFQQQFRAKAWVVRLDAVDAVARYGDATAIPFLTGALEDGEWRIRVAAAQGLGRVRHKTAISPLIAHLEEEQDKRVRRAVAEALFRTTGQHLYDMHDLWIQWWSRNHSGFRVPAAVPTKKKGKGGERRTVASFYGVPVDSERVAFVIDRSGSMGGGFSFGANGELEQSKKTDLDKAIEQTIRVSEKLKDGSHINVIFFETGVQQWSDKLVKLTPGTRRKLRNYLERQQPGGSTNLYGGLVKAMSMRDVDTIYLLSDGSPTEGKYTEDEDVLREIGKLNKRLRIQIHCIALGFRSDLLEKLAAQTGGTYVQK
ncbi:MAG: HEAT repeat domain-containing protein [Planctomycetota bacterium]